MSEYLRVAAVVYFTALAPLILIVVLYAKRIIPVWVIKVYFAMFVICAVGWEIWFTYGWIGGEAVNARRGEELNMLIPMDVNWILNSLADAGTVCMVGLLLVWLLFGRNDDIFRKWNWGAFAVLLFWLLGQNVFVEMVLYHEQLAAGKALSWAPLAPTGPWFNPTLLSIMDRTITLQGQIPWVLTAPIFYGLTIYFRNRETRGDGSSVLIN
jgi:hypothetical protein